MCRPFPVVPIPTRKRVCTATGGDMAGERREYPVIDSAHSNATSRCPMPEMRRAPEQELAGPSFVAGRAQPLGKPLEMRAKRTLP